jgi:hypothetical protein
MPASATQSDLDNNFVTAQFRRVSKINGSDRAVCIHYREDKAWNITQYCKRHLRNYTSFIKWKAEQEKKGVVLGRKRPAESINDFFKPSDLTNMELFAMAIYTSTANFSIFETPEWKAFFKKVHFKPPIRQQLSSDLLYSTYTNVKEQVLKVTTKANYIQIIADGSANISKVRIENTSFLVDGKSYYWKSTEIGAEKAGADWSIKNVK